MNGALLKGACPQHPGVSTGGFGLGDAGLPNGLSGFALIREDNDLGDPGFGVDLADRNLGQWR